MARYRIVVWGAGFFAGKWIQAIAAQERAQLAGVASRSPERATALLRAAGLDAVPVWPAWDASIDPGAADAVVIALPQALHPPAVVRALEAGWHVLVEKPLALDLDSARTVYDAGRRHAGRVVMVNQNFRWRPHVQALRRGLREGLAGTVGHVMFECRQQIRRTTVGGWRERMAEPYLLDFAVHHFDLIRYLLDDEPAAVTGRSFRPSWSWFDGNSAAAALVEMRGGSLVDYGGTMVSSGFETPQEGVITLTGDKGALCLDTRSQVQLATGGDTKTLQQEPVEGGELGYALGEFLTAIDTRREPEVGIGEHIRSLAMAFAVMASGQAGRRIVCDDLVPFLG